MGTTKFNMTRDVAGQNGFGVMPSNQKQGVFLAQNVAQNFTVPNDAPNYLAILTYTPGTNVFVAYNTTAAAFTGTAGAVTSELLPIGRQVSSPVAGGSTISVITPDTGGSYVGIVFYIVMEFGN